MVIANVRTEPKDIPLFSEQSKTMHKEELNMSEAEKNIKKKVEQRAQLIQKRKTSELAGSKPTSKGGPAKVRDSEHVR